MEISLPLKEMSVEDKIRTMETIWDDLTKKAESVPSPSWQSKILKERETATENGKEKFIDWSAAKRQIDDSIS